MPTVSADRIAASPPRPAPPPPPAPAPSSRVSGREVVERNTRGDKTDIKAVARDLREEIEQRPQEATKLTMQALEHVRADDRDELAQEFIRAHDDAGLKQLAQSDAGKGALALAVNELAKGKVHKDEAKDAARVGDALGTQIDLKVNTGWARVSGVIHTVLDFAGFIPGLGAIPDLINAGIYAAEGDWKNAALSSTAAIPLAGDAVKGGSMAVKAGREVLEHGDEALDLAKVAGKRGDDVLQAVAPATQAGSIRNVNKVGGNMNCVNCAVATDATLAGRPASALGGGPFRISVLEKTFGGKFGPAGPIDNITSGMQAAGPGARGIVFGSRSPGQVGHVFNVVNQNGVIRYLDGQIGGAASLGGFADFRLLRTN